MSSYYLHENRKVSSHCGVFLIDLCVKGRLSTLRIIDADYAGSGRTHLVNHANAASRDHAPGFVVALVAIFTLLVQ